MTIRYEHNAGVATVTIDRPEAMNALDLEHDRELAACWQRINEDPEVRVAILTGAGSKSFCAGGDLKSYMPWRRERARERSGKPVSWGGMSLAGQVRKPVIAAINGHCLAGGLELALACDIRLCVPHASLGLAETRWGVLPGGGGTQRLPRAVPLGIALEMILSAEPIDAAEAYRVGLVNRIVAPEALMAAAQALAEKIASRAPLAVAAARRAILEGVEVDLETGLALESRLQEELLLSEDAAEGLRAFAERRPPKYVGR